MNDREDYFCDTVENSRSTLPTADQPDPAAHQ
jgi:hypothetical protein